MYVYMYASVCLCIYFTTFAKGDSSVSCKSPKTPRENFRPWLEDSNALVCSKHNHWKMRSPKNKRIRSPEIRVLKIETERLNSPLNSASISGLSSKVHIHRTKSE